MTQPHLFDVQKTGLSAAQASTPRRQAKRKSRAVLVFIPPHIARALERRRGLMERRAKEAGGR